MLGIWFTPESPRWLMKHGKYDKAFQSFLRLRSHPIIAARDYYYSHVIYQEELHLAKGSSYFSRLWDCFKVPRIRRANYGASTVMIAQQMCGINSTFSSLPWLTSTHNASSHLILQFNYFHRRRLHRYPGSLRFFGLRCRPSRVHHPYTVHDRYRRSKEVMFNCKSHFSTFISPKANFEQTFPLMCVFLLAAGLSLLNTTGSTGSQIGPVVLFVYLFTICYSLGEGPVAFQYSAEVFPTIQREQGMAWAVFINNFFGMCLSAPADNPS